jgi:hypothetical protein
MYFSRIFWGYTSVILFNIILFIYFSIAPDLVRLFSVAAAIIYAFGFLYGVAFTLKNANATSAAQLAEGINSFTLDTLKYLLPTIGFYIAANLINLLSSSLGNIVVIISIFLIGLVLIFSAPVLLAMAMVSLYFRIIGR